MTVPDTTFPAPEFELVPDQQTRMYANVDNQIARYYGNGQFKPVPVQVPTALFTFMREVLKIEPYERVTLYVVPDYGHFVFGMAWGDAETNVADLWYYTPATLPAFLKQPDSLHSIANWRPYAQQCQPARRAWHRTELQQRGAHPPQLDRDRHQVYRPHHPERDGRLRQQRALRPETDSLGPAAVA